MKELLDTPLGDLMKEAERLTLEGHGTLVTYSRKVFIPLTQLCRDVCHYCTFAHTPRTLQSAYLTIDQAVAIAQAGADAGCHEALFTLGDKPELRYSAARRALDEMGYATTLEYLEVVARAVFERTGLLPHLNPGVMTRDDFQRLRPVSVSMGLMLETASDRLSERGGPHFGSPDKAPQARIDTIRSAGELNVPFTTGLLIGIGETRAERIEALLILRELHEQYGHVQEIIIQNFRAKADTKMSQAPEPPLEEHLWTIAVTRLLFGPRMSIQAPPNLQPGELTALVRAGVNDWGGVSPVTADHVNPEAPWPHLLTLESETRAAGRVLRQRLALPPSYALTPDRWLDTKMRVAVLRNMDSRGLAREDNWHPGTATAPPIASIQRSRSARFVSPDDWDEDGIVRLFAADGEKLQRVLNAADQLRQDMCGDTITYVVNRNINYTNVCLYRCGFCAFSKGRSAASLRGPAYRLDLPEIAGRVQEAWAAGATEVCLQGGIHPSYDGNTYLEIVATVKEAAPDMHVHAFSPLEITHGAQTLGLSLETFLRRLKNAGLSTLPGTAAEILDDEIRDIICPDKLRTDEWLEVMRTAHGVGLRTTATIMFGHVEHSRHWARHLLRVRALQEKTGGFTEFVPLPFVHMEAPLWRKGVTRSGPTFRESLLMHAVARLVLHPVIKNIQTSWVKMGAEGAALCLQAGANDLGGTLMNESITRAAGGVNGQEFDAARMIAVAKSIGRPARQRTTLYGEPQRSERISSAMMVNPLCTLSAG